MRFALAASLALLVQPSLAADLSFAPGARLSDAELSTMRGGFMARGFEIQFGLTIESSVDGAPLLSSRLSEATAGQPLQAGDPASAYAFHLARDGHLGVLSNRLDGRVLEQVVTLDVDVLNFRAVTGLGAAQAALRLGDLMRAASTSALPR